jgi:hypothetical protein
LNEGFTPAFPQRWVRAALACEGRKLTTCFFRNPRRNICIRGCEVLRLLLIDVVASVAALGLWFLVFAHYNRKKGTAALRWVQTACAGKGRILESHWMGTSRLQARLHFPSHWFENASVIMRFRPRPLPIGWAMSCWRKQDETLTFEADLGGSPSFYLEVMRHRWSAHNRGISSRKNDDRQWEVYEPGPVILTTRTHWKQDPSAELNALMSARRQEFLQVRFRPESPQFSATVRLEALSDPNAAAEFVSTLREIAAGASTHRQ